MKLNHFTKQLSTLGRWVATTLFCLSAIAFVWQGAFFANTPAMAATISIASRDAGDKIQEKTEEGAGQAKNFIRNTADKVKGTASKNAKKVENSTDSDSLVERKAKNDRDTIFKRANEDAARTEKAVDNTKNAVERAVDNIKDAFN